MSFWVGVVDCLGVDMSRFRTLFRFGLVAAFLVALPAMKPMERPVPAAPLLNTSPTPTPDVYGYKWIDNRNADDPAVGGSGPDFQSLWQNISSSGTQITGISCDDCTATISPPIMIRYYGQNWGTAPAGSGAQIVSPNIVVSSNGNCQFLTSGQSANAGYVNEQFPNGLPASGMNGMVAYLWDDCYGAAGGNARWQVVGNAPNRRLIIQYTGWDFCCSDGPNMEYAVQFTESDGSADSTIYMLYNDITASDPREQGNSATIGIQSPSQNSALNYQYNQATLANGRAIRFYTNQNPNDPTNLGQAADPGGPNKPLGFVSDPTVTFRGTGTDPDASNTIGIQVEILPSTTAFTPAVTGETASTPAGSMVAQGQIAEATYTFDGTPFGSGNYHWRARTIDNAGGASAWVVFNATPIHFVVDLDPPGVPPGEYIPSDGSSIGVPPPAGDVLFKWGQAIDVGPPGPITYRIQVSASAGFAVPLVDDVVPNIEHRATLDISPNPYFWRVAAIDQAGNQGAYMLPIAFIVKFEDGINHGGGDCNISAGIMPGPLMPAAMAALLLAFGLSRRRKK